MFKAPHVLPLNLQRLQWCCELHYGRFVLKILFWSTNWRIQRTIYSYHSEVTKKKKKKRNNNNGLTNWTAAMCPNGHVVHSCEFEYKVIRFTGCLQSISVITSLVNRHDTTTTAPSLSVYNIVLVFHCVSSPACTHAAQHRWDRGTHYSDRKLDAWYIFNMCQERINDVNAGSSCESPVNRRVQNAWLNVPRWSDHSFSVHYSMPYLQPGRTGRVLYVAPAAVLQEWERVIKSKLLGGEYMSFKITIKVLVLQREVILLFCAMP